MGQRRSGAGTMVSDDEREQTLNQLLAEMDGFDPVSGITILAATNRSEVLDPALVRRGRFDRQVNGLLAPEGTGTSATVGPNHRSASAESQPVAVTTLASAERGPGESH